MPSVAFRVAGIEPRHDPAWIVADDATRRDYWRRVVVVVLELKDRELAEGIDRFGEDLAEIAESTRKKGRWRSHTGMGSADAPPLSPAYRASRTRALFAGRAKADHAEFFWRLDVVTGLHWGKVLGWHRAGAGRLPVRDVIGLSPKSMAQLKARMDAWWAAYKHLKASEKLAGSLKVIAPPVPVPKPTVPKPTTTTTTAPTPVSFKFATLGIGDEKLLHQAAAEGKLSAPKKLGEPPAKPKPPGGGTPVPAPPKPKPAPAPPKPAVPKVAALKPTPPPKPAPKVEPPKPKPVAKPAPKPVSRPAPPPKPVEAPKPRAWTPRPQSEFRAFDNGRKMDEWGEAAYEQWAKDLPVLEKNAIRVYTGDNYKWMNAICRGETPDEMPGGMGMQNARRYIENAAAGLRRGRAPEGIVTHRGVQDSSLMGIPDPSKLKPGQELTIEGFGSTTLSRSNAAQFASAEGWGDHMLIMQVNQPRGSTGGFLNAGYLSQYDEEREFLMPPGAKMRFVGMGTPHVLTGGREVPVAIFERVVEP